MDIFTANKCSEKCVEKEILISIHEIIMLRKLIIASY